MSTLTKRPAKVEPVAHDFGMSGITLEGTFWSECRCGWRTPLCPNRALAGDLFDEHLAAS